MSRSARNSSSNSRQTDGRSRKIVCPAPSTLRTVVVPVAPSIPRGSRVGSDGRVGTKEQRRTGRVREDGFQRLETTLRNPQYLRPHLLSSGGQYVGETGVPWFELVTKRFVSGGTPPVELGSFVREVILPERFEQLCGVILQNERSRLESAPGGGTSDRIRTERMPVQDGALDVQASQRPVDRPSSFPRRSPSPGLRSTRGLGRRTVSPRARRRTVRRAGRDTANCP